MVLSGIGLIGPLLSETFIGSTRIPCTYSMYVYNIHLIFIHNWLNLDKTTTSSEGTWSWEESEWSTHESQLHSPWSEQKPAPAGKLYTLQRHSD